VRARLDLGGVLAAPDAAAHVRAWARARVLESFGDEAALLELVLARFLTPGAL